jgi:hypothetical protein
MPPQDAFGQGVHGQPGLQKFAGDTRKVLTRAITYQICACQPNLFYAKGGFFKPILRYCLFHSPQHSWGFRPIQ